jgi:sulfopyruvate decarboxylase TPP-binding subunit
MPSPATAPGLDPKAVAAARSRAIIDALERIAPTHLLWLPSSTLKAVIDHAERRAQDGAWLSFPITREEEAIGIAAGLTLGGGRPVLVIQDNGLGNALTALTTFPQAYHIPLLAIVSQRGGLNEYNSMIHTFCEHVDDVVAAAGLRSFRLDERVPLDRWSATIVAAWEHAAMTHRPVLVLCNLLF